MSQITSHNTFPFIIASQTTIKISSDFDSGNLELATLLSQQSTSGPIEIKIKITPCSQPFNPTYSSKQSTKTFFHFCCESTEDCMINFSVHRMSILGIIQDEFEELYRICVGRIINKYELPIYRKQKPEGMKLCRNGEDYSLDFKYAVLKGQKLYFAYHFPYSCQKLSLYLENLKSKCTSILDCPSPVYFKKQTLIQSIEGRPIYLLTITEQPSHSNIQKLQHQPRISKSLFPHHHIEERAHKFNKPYIMLTARVHPGQTSASYALEGFINKVIDNSDESILLRKNFVIVIVPMINPDGVYHGTYRMDTLGHNLNRFYNNCVTHRQPSIFAIQCLIQHYGENLVAFFDLHSHPQAKGSFVYGNAYGSFHEQIQSQLFAKLLSYNSECFNFEKSSFSEKNMNSKDINDILSKDGSARVCAFKRMMQNNLSYGIHCYGVELGYHGCDIKQSQQKQGFYEFKSKYRRKEKFFGIKDYQQIGEAIANTIVQVYTQSYRIEGNIQKDPQLVNSTQVLRQQIGRQVYEKEERFKNLENGVLKKLKNIHHLIFDTFYGKILKKYPFFEANLKELEAKKYNTKNESNLFRINAPEKKLELVESEIAKNRMKVKQNLKTKKLIHISFQQPNNKYGLLSKISKIQVQKFCRANPLELNIESEKKLTGKNIRQIQVSFSPRVETEFDSLPKINKKRIKYLSDCQKQRVFSYNHQRNDEGKQSPKSTLERNTSYKLKTAEKSFGLFGDQKFPNHKLGKDQVQHEKQFFEGIKNYDTSINPEINPKMLAFEKQFTSHFERKFWFSKDSQRYKKNFDEEEKLLQKPKQTIVTKVDMLRVKQAEKLRNSMIGVKTQRSKYELQLKMRQKYDKQYNFTNAWKVQKG